MFIFLKLFKALQAPSQVNGLLPVPWESQGKSYKDYLAIRPAAVCCLDTGQLQS